MGAVDFGHDDGGFVSDVRARAGVLISSIGGWLVGVW